RLMHNRLRDAKPLSHAKRVCLHLVMDAALQADELDDLVDALLRNTRHHAREVEQVLEAGQIFVHLGIFDDGAYMADRLLIMGPNAMTFNKYIALRQRHKSDHHTDRCRLARTVRPEETEHFRTRQIKC